MWWSVHILVVSSSGMQNFPFEAPNEVEALRHKAHLEKQCERPPNSLYSWLSGPFDSKEEAEKAKLR